ncbi:MAG: hypothetical protein QOD06_890 [Candidatus Binatota bacterium]|jgi:short-subunit dehydrogenase|nr:hypothetical protein [Candidatus Binatota bacterium]
MTTELRRALVTGASSGIGRAIALELAARGFALELVGRSRERLDAVVRDVAHRARAHEADLLDDLQVAAIARAVTRLDLLVHAAGAVALGAVGDAPIGDLDHQYRANLRVPFLLTQALLPLLRASRGQVVFVNSGAGLDARAGWAAYAATKHALRALANALREEEQPRGVRVLSVYPGRTATPMQEAVHRMEGREYDPSRFLQPEDVATQIAAAIELPERAAVLDLSIRPTRA